MTLKQRAFLQRYLRSGNATSAVIDTYNTKSRKSAAVIGSRLLRNVKLKREIDRVYETEESIPSSIAIFLKETLEYGSWKDKAQAIKIALRLYYGSF